MARQHDGQFLGEGKRDLGNRGPKCTDATESGGWETESLEVHRAEETALNVKLMPMMAESMGAGSNGHRRAVTGRHYREGGQEAAQIPITPQLWHSSGR